MWHVQKLWMSILHQQGKLKLFNKHGLDALGGAVGQRAKGGAVRAVTNPIMRHAQRADAAIADLSQGYRRKVLAQSHLHTHMLLGYNYTRKINWVSG